MNIKLKNQKEWITKEYSLSEAEQLSQRLGISEFLARLLVIRGFADAHAAADFLNADDLSFHDPFLLTDMDKAVERIKRAIAEKERILIYGDYDVDGISSVSALYLFLSRSGADVCYYIPERLSEGYGLNKGAIDKFAMSGIDLIITVDTGITACAEAQYINECGMDIIVTDHHECRGELPLSAVAVINPKRPGNKYPMAELAGVGVVFKLICALSPKDEISSVCAEYLDIVSLGTVADVMPIVGENRRIVTHGLAVLNSSRNLGIRALLSKAMPDSQNSNRKVTAGTIGFAIAPRLNAAGRIGDVKRAAELLITNDTKRAEEISEELCALNRERQNIENSILEVAVARIEAGYDFEKNKVIVLADDSWHQGVIGIVASRITEKYGLPCILITFSGDIGKGSARSIPGFNINEAITACKHTLIKCGGHELAAGLSLERESFEEFKAAINDYAFDKITDEMRTPCLYADCEIEADEIDMEHAVEIGYLEPYGNGNPSPVFILKDAVIESVTPIGMNKHLKLVLQKDGKSFSALYFNKTPEEFEFLQNFTVDVAFNLEINEFRGSRSVQLNIKDMRKSEKDKLYINRQGKDYLRAIASNMISKENLPDMQAFRAAFIYLRTFLKNSENVDVYKMSVQISRDFSISVTPCMLNIMLDVFAEMGLASVERASLNDASVSLISVDGKVNLENSCLLTRLREAII
ncbi:MAG: single-stranded-DNA-specific exonuclease RecJ [Clostridia bacterium]|nr:single-stranded-DNA-specific exonuclease RecJ [Clostridia bacterium]